MDEQFFANVMYKAVSMACEKLNDLELAVLNTVVQLDADPHNRLFDYNKVESLFTENNGTKAHQMTKEALAQVVLQRLGQ